MSALLVVAANLLMNCCGLVMIVHDDVTEYGRISTGLNPRKANRLRNAM